METQDLSCIFIAGHSKYIIKCGQEKCWSGVKRLSYTCILSIRL